MNPSVSLGDVFLLLSQSYNMCPSSMHVIKENCKAAGLAVRGVPLYGKVKEVSLESVPFGCSLNVNDGREIIYNSFHGNNNGDYQPVCSTESFCPTLTPSVSPSDIPSMI
eukprot:CAMPEP_0184863526 /NCGR_PEP_ID=MMETSP0580-20130426/11468_1 /TAXON_ID=1118495 /ORGANISM="Dactyliosolen fragilissimus" /LENGTH=109 /DNA_ID=CAMNT_0027361905 /DNA_START=65 /DNA_END=391 /DNA_ORIENTATION=-